MGDCTFEGLSCVLCVSVRVNFVARKLIIRGLCCCCSVCELLQTLGLSGVEDAPFV